MANKKRKTLDDYLYQHFHFHDTNEFIIFLVWGLFVSAFLITLTR